MTFLKENYGCFLCFDQLLNLELFNHIHFGLPPEIQGGDNLGQLAAPGCFVLFIVWSFWGPWVPVGLGCGGVSGPLRTGRSFWGLWVPGGSFLVVGSCDPPRAWVASCKATFAPCGGRSGQLSISDPLSDGDGGVAFWNLDDFTSSLESDSLPLETDLTLLFSK